MVETNVIYCGDCLLKLKEIPDNSIDLIYIDPPFSSNRNYVAFWEEQEKRHFEDRFENVGAYLDYMLPRVKEIYRVLRKEGSFLYHCDWHASHYVKLMLDRDDLFGYSNFQNEIVWYFRGLEFHPRDSLGVMKSYSFIQNQKTGILTLTQLDDHMPKPR